jgi:hypothetical protein
MIGAEYGLVASSETITSTPTPRGGSTFACQALPNDRPDGAAPGKACGTRRPAPAGRCRSWIGVPGFLRTARRQLDSVGRVQSELNDRAPGSGVGCRTRLPSRFGGQRGLTTGLGPLDAWGGLIRGQHTRNVSLGYARGYSCGSRTLHVPGIPARKAATHRVARDHG